MSRPIWADAVAETMSDIRSLTGDNGEPGRDGTDRDRQPTRADIEAVRDRLIELSEQRELFSFEQFPVPDDSGALYRLSQDDDGRFALYLNASSRSSTPVHNHTTWAAVVGVRGQELNRFYRRVDDGSGGVGVEETHQHMVEYGTGVAMLADDLHAIAIEAPSLHFHCYGLGLELLTERNYFNPHTGTWKVFPPSSDIREARPGMAEPVAC